MPNVAAVLKEEIARVARKEVRAETEKLKKLSAQYRIQITELRQQVAELQRDVARLSKIGTQTNPVVERIDVGKVRWSPTRFKAHRERLELSAEKFGKLFNVTGQTIYNWENGARPGKEQLSMLARVRKLSKRQAHALVEAK